jgi:S1-C subfamily serine protease
MLDLVDPKKHSIRKIGVLAMDADHRTMALLPPLRIQSGVVVVANTNYGSPIDFGLRPGDVIHSINTKAILSLEQLQKEIRSIHAGTPVVLQVERSDGMDYVTFEME